MNIVCPKCSYYYPSKFEIHNGPTITESLLRKEGSLLLHKEGFIMIDEGHIQCPKCKYIFDYLI